MASSTTTLEDVERTLESQDRELETAYAALMAASRGQPLPLSAELVERFERACRTGAPKTTAGPPAGIRC
jgi:hypothetical protein